MLEVGFEVSKPMPSPAYLSVCLSLPPSLPGSGINQVEVASRLLSRQD